MFEDLGGQHHVDLLAGHIDDARAHLAQHEVEDDGDDHADAERDQRGDRAVRNNAVVDVHDEDRRGERQDVDDQRRDRDVAVIFPEPADDGPEPARLRHAAGCHRARVGLHRRTHEEGVAEIVGGVRAERDTRAAGNRRIDDGRALNVAAIVAADKNARRAVFHDQHGRKHERRNFGDRAAHGFRLESGTRGRAFEQGDGEAAVLDRQRGEQRLTAQRTAVMGGKEQQRIGQRIAGRRRGGCGFRGLCELSRRHAERGADGRLKS